MDFCQNTTNKKLNQNQTPKLTLTQLEQATNSSSAGLNVAYADAPVAIFLVHFDFQCFKSLTCHFQFSPILTFL